MYAKYVIISPLLSEHIQSVQWPPVSCQRVIDSRRSGHVSRQIQSWAKHSKNLSIHSAVQRAIVTIMGDIHLCKGSSLLARFFFSRIGLSTKKASPKDEEDCRFY